MFHPLVTASCQKRWGRASDWSLAFKIKQQVQRQIDSWKASLTFQEKHGGCICFQLHTSLLLVLLNNWTAVEQLKRNSPVSRRFAAFCKDRRSAGPITRLGGDTTGKWSEGWTSAILVELQDRGETFVKWNLLQKEKKLTEKPTPLQVISNHPLFRRVLSPSSSFVRHTRTETGIFVGLRLHAARVHPSSRRTDTLTDEKKPAAALAIQHNPCNLLQHDSHSQEGAEWNLSGCRRPEAERGKKKNTLRFSFF